MTGKIDEGEWVALVTRIEEAMTIHPFMPRQEDVITLLSMAVNGNQHMLRVEDLERVVERLRAAAMKLDGYWVNDTYSNTKNVSVRETAFADLRDLLGLKPKKYV